MHYKTVRGAVLLLFIFLFFHTTPRAREKLQVLTTFSLIADMAQNVAGEAADVYSIIKPGADIHNYQPTPGDIRRAHRADLILWNGLGLELWFRKFFKRLKNVPSVVISDGVKVIYIRGGGYSGKPDPHAWMSSENALIYIRNIRNALIEQDPENTEIYRENERAYAEKIKATFAPFKERFESLPEDERWLVTSEGAFSYLSRDLGLRELYLWPINSSTQGTPQQVKRIIDTIRKHKIKVIFSESTISPKPARQVATETGIGYGGVLYVDSLSLADGPVPTYLDLLRVTVRKIEQALINGKQGKDENK